MHMDNHEVGHFKEARAQVAAMCPTCPGAPEQRFAPTPFAAPMTGVGWHCKGDGSGMLCNDRDKCWRSVSCGANQQSNHLTNQRRAL